MSANVIVLQGLDHHRKGRLDQAEALYRKALAANPGDFDALNLLGALLIQRGAAGQALAPLTEATKLRPRNPDALMRLASVHRSLGDHARAERCYRKLIQIEPNFADGHFNHGNLLAAVGRIDEAAGAYRRCIQLQPRHAAAYHNLAELHCAVGQSEAGLGYFKTLLRLEPHSARAHLGLGLALDGLGRLEEALAANERGLALETAGNDIGAAAAVLGVRQKLCAWDGWTALRDRIGATPPGVSCNTMPFTLLAALDEPALHRRAAEDFMVGKRLPTRAPPSPARDARRIRIAYLSADLHVHATTVLMAGVLEAHDRSRFEVHLVSWGEDDGSAMRKRLKAACHQFHEVRQSPDIDVADRLRSLDIHIAVDLKGHTRGARPALLSLRPAPVQVGYLGYPGTIGTDCLDYVIADAFVLPFDQQPFYPERIVHLPGCYQPNSDARQAGDRKPRQACGLPESGFVFACFNNTYKTTPEVFAVWMNLLRAVPDSVLWLYRDNHAAGENLRREAEAAGVDPGRLVFADKVVLEDHLARIGHADLFLDTLPYNAHTTASDALWAGVPVVTCAGRSFAARVAGSLLHAVGLPELVTERPDDYEALALALARDPSRLAGIRDTLRHAVETSALFAPATTCRHLEAAYEGMYRRWLDGQAPEAFAVPAA